MATAKKNFGATPRVLETPDNRSVRKISSNYWTIQHEGQTQWTTKKISVARSEKKKGATVSPDPDAEE